MKKYFLMCTMLLCMHNYNIAILEENVSKNEFIKNEIIDEQEKIIDDKYCDLINKDNKLSCKYIPPDLITLNVYFPNFVNGERKQMRKDAGIALQNMFLAAKKENIHLAAISGYRSFDTQKNIYNYNVNTYGEKYANTVSAKPGTSEHQSGLAMDISCDDVNYDLVDEFKNTLEGKWLKDNSYKYGFIIRYPEGKEDITGYIYEPWHVRYVGKDIAKYIYDNDLTLEEYWEEIIVMR